MAKALQVIVTGAVIAIVLFTGTLVLDEMQSGDVDSTTRQAASITTGEFTTLNDGDAQRKTIYETTGYAVKLSGQSDSFVQSQAGFTIASDATFTVSAWGKVASGAGGTEMTLLDLDGRVLITYDGAESQWEGWYYDDGGENSYQVNVSASGNEVDDFTNVQVWSNGTDLTIYRNGTQGEIKDITTSSITSAPVSATNWNGRLEEVRTFDDPLSSSQRSSLVSGPTEELPGPSPTSRAMFDQPNRGTQLLIYTDTRLSQSNVAFEAGFPEDVQSEGTDYEWDDEGPRIKPLSGGDLDGAPVVYATYDFNSRGVLSVIGGWGSLVQLAILIPLIALGLLIMSKVETDL